MRKLSDKLWLSEVGSIVYYCPGCKLIHIINVAPSKHPKWEWDSNTISPTLRPSILSQGRNRCHHYLRSGKLEYLKDCDHEYAGRTIDLPDMPDDEIEWLDDES